MPYGLNPNYTKSDAFIASREIVTFIQFLTYFQTLNFEIVYVDRIAYRVFDFRLVDFIKLQNKPNN